MQTAHVLVSVLDWWKSEILQVFPLKKLNQITDDAPLGNPTLIKVFKQGYQLKHESDKSTENIFLTLNELEAALRASKSQAAVDLILDADRYLERSISSLRLPAYRARQMAEADLTISTPFKHHENYIFLCDKAGTAQSYYIVKNSILNPVLICLKDIDLEVVSVSLSSLKKETLLSKHDKSYILAKQKTSWPFARICLISLFLLLALTGGHFIMIDLQTNQKIDAKLLKLETKVAKTRLLVSNQKNYNKTISNAIKFTQDSLKAHRIWSELSRIIPDSAWLTTLQAKDKTATLTGYSRSAAGLVSLIQSSDIFENPNFSSPVVTIKNEALERFSIQVSLEKK